MLIQRQNTVPPLQWQELVLMIVVCVDILITVAQDSHKISVVFASLLIMGLLKKSLLSQTEEKEEEDLSGEPKASPSADTTILFVKGEGKSPVLIYHLLYSCSEYINVCVLKQRSFKKKKKLGLFQRPCLEMGQVCCTKFLTVNYFCVLDFPANNIVKFLVGFTNKGTEDFIVESLDASFRYPQDYQFYIQNFTALPLNTVVPPQRQATFEYSFIPAEPMGGRPFGLVINLNYRDVNVSLML